MFIAMQIYREGNRTFFNKVSGREYTTLEAAAKCAQEKGKGLTYVVCGKDVVWTSVSAKRLSRGIQQRNTRGELSGSVTFS